MKINIYAVCLVILCSSQVYASAPAAQQAVAQAPETPRAGWVEVVNVSPKTAFRMAVMSVVLQVRASQLETLKAELAKAKAAAAQLKKRLEPFVQAQEKERLEGLMKFQNDPANFGNFPSQNN